MYTTKAVNEDCTVSASFAENIQVSHTIKASDESHGEIIPEGDVKVAEGADQSFEIKADFGYLISEVIVDGSEVDIPRNTSFTYTFHDVRADHTIKARFRSIIHFISATAEGNGSISPSGQVAVDDGADQAFAMIPEAGASIVNVFVDGATVGPVLTYLFPNVTSNHSILASFTMPPVTHTVGATSGPGGSIEPASATVVHGETQQFTITPAAGYHLLGPVGGTCGGALEGSIFTTNAVTADCTVTANFEPDQVAGYQITATAGAEGTIDPLSAFVPPGALQHFTISPGENFLINEPVAGTCPGTLTGTTYTVGPVNQDCTVEVSFSPIPIMI
jgi:hypothetical protein